MKIPARMYTANARTVVGLENATLKRCEGEEEGVGTAAQIRSWVQSNCVDVLTSKV
jgi:hypothetical protein